MHLHRNGTLSNKEELLLEINNISYLFKLKREKKIKTIFVTAFKYTFEEVKSLSYPAKV